MITEDLRKKLTGVHAYLVTPLTEKDEINVEGLRENIQFLIQNNVSVIVPCGGTGEFDSLTQEERKKALVITIEEAGSSKALVISPVGGSLKEAVELAQYAQEKGAQAVIIRPPKIRAQDRGLHNYYSRIIKEVNIGVIIHRLPEAALSVDLIRQLTEIDNIVAVKDEAEDNYWFREIVDQLGDKILLICGGVAGGEMAAPCYYMLGARAFSSGVVNFICELPLRLHETLITGDYSSAKEIQKKLAPIQELRSRRGITNAVPVIKEALDLLGLHGGPVRPPLAPLFPKEKEDLKKILKDLGLLS